MTRRDATPLVAGRGPAPRKPPPPKQKPPPRDVVFAELRRRRSGGRHETYCHAYAAEHYGTPRLPLVIELQHLGDGTLRCPGPDGGIVDARPLVATRFRFTGEVQDRPVSLAARNGTVRVAIYEEEAGWWG